MKKCEECGNRFDPEDAQSDFTDVFPLLNYDNFTRCLCAECAIRIAEDQDEGEYFEYCEKCGTKFDRFEHNQMLLDQCGRDIDYFDLILCVNCAYDAIQEEIAECQEDDDDEIPEGCSACGGPYPNCIDSCAAFGN